ELMQVAVGLQERILHHVFRVFAVLRDVLRDPEYVTVVPSNELFEGCDVTGLGSLYQRHLVAYRLLHFWLDGTHSLSDATIFAARSGSGTAILLAFRTLCVSRLTILSGVGLQPFSMA